MAQPRPGKRAQMGFDHMSVTVESIEGKVALVVDQFGVKRQLPVNQRRGNGSAPRSGERWTMTRSMGQWTFDTVLLANPHEIDSSHLGIPALRDLLIALGQQGLIADASTALAESTYDETWNALPPLQSGWTGGGTYRKVVGGMVLLRGLLQHSSPSASVAFTLPADCRPSAAMTLLGYSDNTQAPTTGTSHGSSHSLLTPTGATPVRVAVNGEVRLERNTYLDGVTFLAEP